MLEISGIAELYPASIVWRPVAFRSSQLGYPIVCVYIPLGLRTVVFRTQESLEYICRNKLETAGGRMATYAVIIIDLK